MMKKIMAAITVITLLLSLTACGDGGDSQPEDPLAVAQQEFNYEVDNLTRVRKDLKTIISKAEDLLETVTETDVTDVTVLNDLQTALENSKNAPKLITIPAMKSTPEEIQQQRGNLAEQTNTISNFYDDLQSAISRVEESQEAKQVEFENMNTFDAARSMGYEVEELWAGYDSKYVVSFSYNGSSFSISSKDEPSGDIIFHGEGWKKIEKGGMDPALFYSTTFYFSDDGNASRDSGGHWIFSTEQKKQLLNLLSNFKKSGPSSFMDGLSPVGSNYLSPEMSSLVKEFGLSVAYQMINGGYRFMISDGENLAWFSAVYSDADFRPSNNVSELHTYKNVTNEYQRLWPSFPTDYVNNGHLISEPERAEQLRNFFAGAKQAFLTSINPIAKDEKIVIEDNATHTSYSDEKYSHYLYSNLEGSSVTWNLDGKFSTLSGLWTLCYTDRNTTEQEAFEIYADNALVYTSPVLTGGSDAVAVNVSINNCQELKIVFISGDGGGEFGNVTLYK